MPTRSTPLWLSWETHRRSTNLAKQLNAELLAIDFTKRGSAIRYTLSCLHTVRALVSRRPKVIIAQNPSIALCALAALLKPLFSYRYVIDAHNHALDVSEQAGLMGILARAVFRAADLTIVTNPIAAKRVLYSEVAVLPDPVSAISGSANSQTIVEKHRLISGQYALMICSFDPDEPVEAVVDAVMSIAENKRPVLAISGKRSKAHAVLLARECEWVVFLDYLPDEEYEALISAAQLLIDLTDYEDGLVCGFAESIAVGVPILLSDNLVSRATFEHSALYTRNTPADIRSNIESFLAGKIADFPDALSRKNDFEERWNLWFERCRSAIYNGNSH